MQVGRLGSRGAFCPGEEGLLPLPCMSEAKVPRIEGYKAELQLVLQTWVVASRATECTGGEGCASLGFVVDWSPDEREREAT